MKAVWQNLLLIRSESYQAVMQLWTSGDLNLRKALLRLLDPYEKFCPFHCIAITQVGYIEKLKEIKSDVQEKEYMYSREVIDLFYKAQIELSPQKDVYEFYAIRPKDLGFTEMPSYEVLCHNAALYDLDICTLEMVALLPTAFQVRSLFGRSFSIAMEPLPKHEGGKVRDYIFSLVFADNNHRLLVPSEFDSDFCKLVDRPWVFCKKVRDVFPM